MGNSIGCLDQKSLISNVEIRLRDRTLLFRYLVLINLIIGAWYLYWRSTQSLNTDALWFSIPLLFAEIYMYVGGVIFLLGLWKPIERRVKDLSGLIPSLSESDYPTVDVFITCYNEPVEIVEATAGAALQMDYPVNKLRVYILDDGNSSDMRAMAERLCLHDLESPELRHAASQLNTERYRLMSRFEQLQYLKGDLSDIDEWLSPQCLQVSTDYSELSTVMAWFNAMKSPIVPDEVWVACQTLLGEGFDNAICHAHKHLPSDTPIQLQLVILNYAVILHIWDQGLPFDLEERLQNLPDTIDENAERGRGLSILSQLTDHLAYVRTSDGKNCLTMIKKFLPQSVIDKGQCYQQSQQLQAIHQLLSLSRQGHSTSTDTLNDELQDLEQQITEKVSEMADLSRCRYIARIKPTDRPHHAKAGNINHAIFCGETHGDFILTLDADHIPKPQFLQRVLPNFLKFNLDRGHYELNRIAFVQTPQAFYNLPKSDPFGHDAHFFYGPIQQGKDGMNAAFYTGTNAILRREALVNMGLQHFAADFEVDEKRLEEFDLIGGLSSVSITEDMNTAMRLHSSGWRSAYHHEVLAEGLAPDDLRSTLLQKLRWAQGTIQVLLRDNPLLKPGLTFWQRIQYFQTMYSYFAGFFVAILLLCPIISFFTGLVPVRNFSPDFALHFVPAYLLNRLTLMAASQGIPMQELWRNEQYAIALFPLQIQAVWSVFTGRKITFQVTPKQRQSGVYLNLVRVQLLVCALTVAGMVWGLWQVISGQWPNAWTYIINVGWGCYHIALLWVVIRAAYWQPKPATESC